MAFLAFSGDRVGAVNSANDDGSGGVDLELDTDRDLDGSGNPYYSPTSTIVIEIDDADIGPNGEFQEAGDDGVVTVLSIKVDGVEILSDTDKVKFGGGGDTFEGDGFFFVECVKLFFLSPIYTDTFADAVVNSGKLELNVPDRVSDNDFNENSTIDSGTTEVGNGIFNTQTSNVVCYASGTMIPTPDGEVPVETLEASDSVATIDQGFLPIRWIGSRTLSEAELEQTPNLRPIRIRSGALGQGTPAVDLVVSPQHRILIRSKIAERMFDSAEVLIAAKHLLGMDGIKMMLLKNSGFA